MKMALKIELRKTVFIALLTISSFAPLGSLANASEFTVASFNTWGVPMVVWDTWRYQEAMNRLADMRPDFIALEEVFSKKGRNAFYHDDYPYAANGPGSLPRLVGSGLRILSKHPILKVATLVYRSCVKDDCLSRKGALLIVAKLPDNRHINLIVTHLNARGVDATRNDQLDQLQEFIDEYAEKNAPTLITGDFNFNPSSDSYRYLQKKMAYKDLWIRNLSNPEADYSFDAGINTYAREYAVRTNFPLTRERIDYFFSTEKNTLRTQESRLIFNQAPFMSDHFGLWGRFQLPENIPTPSDSGNSLSQL